MAAICAAGLPVAVVACVASRQGHVPYGWPSLVALALVVIAGEMMPIEFARRGRPSDEVTISTTFVLAMVFSAPLGLALAAQAAPLVMDDIRRRKHWSRPVFNVAQYALAIIGARATFCLLSHHRLWVPDVLRPSDLPAALAAGLTFLVLNHGLVGAAVAIAADQPIVQDLLDDAAFELATSGLLAAFAPMVLVAVAFSPLLLPVMLLPVVAVRRSAQLAAQREYDALHDGLTGLPNRLLFQHELSRALQTATPDAPSAAVLMLDLNHFKEINDTLGHDVGDLLLVEVAGRLARAVEAGMTPARLGGDEFALLLPVEGGPDTACAAATALAERVLEVLREPITLAKVRIDVPASIGIALAGPHGEEAAELLARADVAMDDAKEGGCGWVVYDPEKDQHTPERLALLADLRDAIPKGQLVVHYQPKCSARTGEVVGAEALVRWMHPRLGLLSPDAFIGLAENTGLIRELTLVVLDEALRQLRLWLDLGLDLGVAVNLSARHLANGDLPVQVEEALRRHAVPGRLLTLEVTEGTIMQDPGRAVLVLARLRELGVKVAVDDYGTGYSSLAYLKRLAVDELKIDKSFIVGVRDNENDAIIVRSTIELGHSLGLSLVAEGVEDAKTWQLLDAWDCDVLQGYYISRPLPATALLQWLRDGSDRRTPSRGALARPVRHETGV
jgi:diguanylate cyclase (GGDEF)-like protein